MQFGLTGWFGSDATDTSKMTDADFRAKSFAAINSFVSTAKKNYGLKQTTQQVVDYINTIHPTFLMHFGKQIIFAQDSGVNIGSVMQNLAKQSQGKLPVTATDLNVLTNALQGQLTGVNLWKTVGLDVGKKAIETGSAIGEKTLEAAKITYGAATGVMKGIETAGKNINLIIYGGIGLIAVYLIFNIKSMLKVVKKK